ncbi:MAG: YncE family protein [Betaproteobacteria bacterium]
MWRSGWWWMAAVLLAVLAGIGLTARWTRTREVGRVRYAFVANEADGTVSKVDLLRRRQVAAYRVGRLASHGVAASPDGHRAYGGNLDDGEIKVLDGRSGRLVRSIRLGARAHGIDLSPDGRWLFVSSGSLTAGERFDQILVVDTRTGRVAKRLVYGGKSPAHVDVDKRSSLLFAADVLSDDVAILSLPLGRLIARVPVGRMPNEVAVSPDGRRAYSANVPAGKGTHGITVSRDGKHVWTANRISKDVTVIDARTNRVVRTIPVGAFANHVAFSENGRYAYVTRLKDLAVIDARRFRVIGYIPVGKSPHEISLEDLK